MKAKKPLKYPPRQICDQKHALRENVRLELSAMPIYTILLAMLERRKE